MGNTWSASRTHLIACAAMLLTNSFGELAKAQETIWLPPINVTATRLSNGITGASTTVLTAQDIERSPARTVQEVLATIPGVQIRSLYGGVNGAGTSVDLRGFGAFATANTLVLVNGRRLNDLDLAGVDLSTIPRESIERIEVTRGNSGAVLYGDNAVGGVVNIITKTALAKPSPCAPKGASVHSTNVKGMSLHLSSRDRFQRPPSATPSPPMGIARTTN